MYNKINNIKLKKILISIVAISSVIIAGCGNNTQFEFEFDNFD
jgi:outer membrane murein-binding lipoprotein Lpp